MVTKILGLPCVIRAIKSIRFITMIDDCTNSILTNTHNLLIIINKTLISLTWYLTAHSFYFSLQLHSSFANLTEVAIKRIRVGIKFMRVIRVIRYKIDCDIRVIRGIGSIAELGSLPQRANFRSRPCQY